MLVCSNPFQTEGGDHVGCGQCMACRVRRRVEWSTRLQLEARCHQLSCVVTLTYSDEELPPGGELVKRDVQLWLKRVRKRFGSFRYHVVGEYGEMFGRPHYHATLFGLFLSPEDCASTWGKGRVSVDVVTESSCNYVAGYVTKKWTSASEEKLNGRPPEFSLMSLKPGLGALAVPALADPCRDTVGQLWVAGRGDVPSTFRIGPRQKVIGRYLRQKLREELGRDEEQPVARYRRNTEVWALRQSERARLRDSGLSAHEAAWAERARPGHVNFSKAEAIAARQTSKGKL